MYYDIKATWWLSVNKYIIYFMDSMQHRDPIIFI